MARDASLAPSGRAANVSAEIGTKSSGRAARGSGTYPGRVAFAGATGEAGELMRQVLVRRRGTLALAGALAVGLVAAAAPAGAVEPGIRTPTLTVVCTQPHHGKYFTAVRFSQHGKWAAGGAVRVTVARAKHAAHRAVLHTQTGPHGWFHLTRMLAGDGTPTWAIGTRYTWTTSIHGDTWATARRGSVELTGSC